MAAKNKEDAPPKRLNRTVGAGEAVLKALDPVFRKRGFASRDILTHWQAMAPAPYDKVTLPDRLAWPRGDRGAEGATLYLRCVAGHAMAVAHDGPAIAAAVNRYFGYVLVGNVRISAEPFTPGSTTMDDDTPKPTESARVRVDGVLAKVSDDGIKEALRGLGHAIMAKHRK